MYPCLMFFTFVTYLGKSIRLSDFGFHYTRKNISNLTPEVMNYGLRFLHERYQLPLYISENGVACNDRIYADGQVHDYDRIDFLEQYLKEMEKGMENGCDIRGYFQWSLMDNLEWHSGYDPRFGLIFIDFRNQQRIWKDSAKWYKEYIAARKA